MLEQLLIFTRGGLILWTCKELGNALKGSPIDTLIRSCLLEERSADSSYNYEAPGAAYTLKWTFNNDLGLIFVAVYQKILHLLYVDDLLALVKKEFSEIYDPKRMNYYDFDDVFRQLRNEVEARAEELKRSKQVGGRAAAAAPVALAKKQGQAAIGRSDGSNGKQNGNGSSKDGGSDSDSAKEQKENGNPNGHHQNGVKKNVVVNKNKDKENRDSEAFDVNKLLKLRSKGAKKQENVVAKAPAKAEPKKKATKKNRVWDDSPKDTKLDFADPVDERGMEKMEGVAENHGESMMDKEEVFSSDSESEEEEDEVAGKDPKLSDKKKGWFSSMFQ
ncbi:hypothetical protein MKW94_013812, partial [Papaver nudicaule]|nr:hypothetical protein [Papaver nudicaule]